MKNERTISQFYSQLIIHFEIKRLNELASETILLDKGGEKSRLLSRRVRRQYKAEIKIIHFKLREQASISQL